MPIVRRLLWLLLLLSFQAIQLLAVENEKPPSLILITIDTTRADRVGFLGSKLGLTPNLDALAEQGAVFSRAYAHVPLTTPSHATILTGTYPQFNHLGSLGTALAKDLPYLPQILRTRGYTTAAFVGSQVLDPKSAAAPGFSRGFDIYDAGFHSRNEGEDRYSSEERRAGKVVDHALAWLGKQTKRPIFLWVHFYDPHDPYDPPEPFKSKYSASPYDGEIAYMDSALGRLFAGLKAVGLYDSALIAVVADHGEAFGEHGEESHGYFLYDETIHVPLMIKLPSARVAGEKIDAPIGLVDVAPTLLSALGAEIPASMQGKSLLPLIEKKGAEKKDVAPEGPIYSETDYPESAFGWSWLRALRSGKYLYIDAPRRELYDLSSDPKASHNLAESNRGVADTLQAQLDQFRQKTSRQGSAQANISPQVAEKLQALGYVTSASHGSNAAGSKRGPDPKDLIETANLLHHALQSVDEEHYRPAIPQLERVLKVVPNMALANQEMGRALNGVERYSEAIPYLQKAIELNPQSGRARFELGAAYGATENWPASAAQFEAAVSRLPDSDDLRFFLGFAYDNMGRTTDAEKAYREALRINPNHFKANLMLGRVLGMQNNFSGALPYLQKAAKLQPTSTDVHQFLANVYQELGQMDNARREQAEAARLGRSAHP
ncbi:MAG TPA: sulfatase-like hydrolase/transferase [Candidatus Solibacter sp.]|nr:sulfatase-like hydrolase/transferase [Candidatus Solibacter sp.]